MDDDRSLPYDAWPLCWLIRVHGRYQDALASALAGAGMDAPTWRIVMILKENDWMTVSGIAARANARLSTMTRSVRRMVAAGFMLPRRGVRDRRATEACLTREGKGLIGPAGETARYLFNRAFAGFEPEKRALLRALLGDVAKNLR